MRILLLSGGLDSTTLLYNMDETPDLCLSVDYGQPHVREVGQAIEICATLGVPHEVAKVSFAAKPDNGLLGGHDDTAAASVVSGRNAAFIALAAMRGASSVVMGCNADDQEDYIDCRTKVLKEVGKACGVTIELPFVGLQKWEIAKIARELEVPIDKTVSCYRGHVCCKCAACAARGRAMAYPEEHPRYGAI